jgi:hypothetical protein
LSMMSLLAIIFWPPTTVSANAEVALAVAIMAVNKIVEVSVRIKFPFVGLRELPSLIRDDINTGFRLFSELYFNSCSVAGLGFCLLPPSRGKVGMGVGV